MRTQHFIYAFLLLCPLFLRAAQDVQFIRQTDKVLTQAEAENPKLPWTFLADTKADPAAAVPADAPRFVCAAMKDGTFQFRIEAPYVKDSWVDLELVRHTAGFAGQTIGRFRYDPDKQVFYRIVSRTKVQLPLRDWCLFRKKDDKRFSFAVTLSPETLIHVSNSVPYAPGRNERWEVRVMLGGTSGHFYAEKPDTATVYVFPRFHAGDIREMQSKYFGAAAAEFLAPEPERSSAGFDGLVHGLNHGWYIRSLADYYLRQPLWTKQWYIPANVSYPFAQSWGYYWEKKKWEEPDKMFIKEYQKFAQDEAERAADPLAGPYIFLTSFRRFSDPPYVWDRLRLEGCIHHIFAGSYPSAGE